MVLTARPLGKNQPIGASDIQVKKMNLARVPSKALFDPKQVIGKRSSRTIAVNTILRSDQVHEPLMVRKGGRRPGACRIEDVAYYHPGRGQGERYLRRQYST